MPMTTVWQQAAWCWQTTVSSVQTTSLPARAARTTNTSTLAGALSALKVSLVLFHGQLYDDLVQLLNYLDLNTLFQTLATFHILMKNIKVASLGKPTVLYSLGEHNVL